MKINKVKSIYFLVLLFVVLLSIGYSAFNVSLNIKDTVAYFRINQDIRITGFSINSASDKVISDYEEYNYDKLSSLVTLPNSDSYITYRIDVTNFETAEMGIYDITGLSDNLEYEISNYTLKDRICDSANKCNLGITKDIYLTIKYKEDGYDSSNTKYNINLDVIFKEIYDVEYSGITNNGYPTYIMSGETLKVTFKDFIPYNVVPYIDGIKLDYDKYTYLDGILTIDEVSGNVLIEYIEKVYLTTLSEGTYFKEDAHRENIKTVEFVGYVDVPSDNIATYDLSNNQDGTIIGWIDKDYNLYIGSDWKIYGKNLSNAFKNMTNVENVTFNNLNTSEVTDMSQMFNHTGGNENLKKFSIVGIDNWNVSNVIHMNHMFYYAGRNATEWSIGDLSNWDVSRVVHMHYMFLDAGSNAKIFDIGNVGKWDVSKVINMLAMFSRAGQNANEWNIGDLSGWDTSKVTNMSGMFETVGYNATEWEIGDLSNWDTSKVTDMNRMFANAGQYAKEWNIGDLSNWDVSKVTNMRLMFYFAGLNATDWNIGDLSNWDTSQVINMEAMFFCAGRSATTFNIGNLNTKEVTREDGTTYTAWDVSQVTNMYEMIYGAGFNATEWNIGDLSNWDTSQVTSMLRMFANAGYNAETFDIGNIGNWNVSKVTNMQSMFNAAGYNATEWNIGDLSKWNTSQVADMAYMFYNTGVNSTNDWSLDLSTKEVTLADGTTYTAWNVSNVTSYDGFNTGVESKITAPVWVN